MPRPIRTLLEWLFLALMLALTTAAIRWLLVRSQPPSSPSPASPTVSTSPSPSPSPTPTQSPFTPTPSPTPSPTARSTPSSTPTPLIPPHATLAVTPPATTTPHPLPMPTPMPAVELPESVINIVLLGVDQEEAVNNGWRTDVIVVVSINPEDGFVSLLSIPRDLYVWIPSHGFDRMNAAGYRGELMGYPGGGSTLVKATIEYNLGIPIHYYARVDFAGFIGIVDTLGGVDVPVECELHDTFPNPENPEEGIDVDFTPGIQHLDGRHALWYVRSRWSTHDFDRNRRQQQVLRALYRQALDLDVLSRIPQLWGAIRGAVETDLGLDEMIYLGLVSSRLSWTDIKSRFISSAYLTYWTSPNGAHVLLPIPGALGPVIAEALQPPAAGRANQPPFNVEVIDGTGRPGLAAVAVERLRWEGFVVTGVTPAEQAYPRTQIVDLTTTTKGSPLWLISRLYRRSADDIVRQPTEGSSVDFRIILGSDYDPCVSTTGIQYVPAPTPTPNPAPDVPQ